MRSEVVFDVDPAHEDPRAKGDGPASIDLDGRGRLLVAAGSWAGLLLAETGEIVRTLDGFPGRRAEGRYRFFEGGRTIAGFARGPGGARGALFTWAAADGSEVGRIDHPDVAPIVDVSPAGFAITTKGPTAWDLGGGERLLSLSTPAAIRGGALFVDERLALLGSRVFWDVADGRYREIAGFPLSDLTLLPDGRIAAGEEIRGAMRSPIHVMRREDRMLIEERELPRGSRGPLAASNDALVWFDRRAAWLVRIGDAKTLAIATPREVTGACFSADGRRLFAAGEDGLVRAWKIDLVDRYG
jgi:hypothetical protein